MAKQCWKRHPGMLQCISGTAVACPTFRPASARIGPRNPRRARRDRGCRSPAASPGRAVRRQGPLRRARRLPSSIVSSKHSTRARACQHTPSLLRRRSSAIRGGHRRLGQFGRLFDRPLRSLARRSCLCAADGENRHRVKRRRRAGIYRFLVIAQRARARPNLAANTNNRGLTAIRQDPAAAGA